MKKVIFSSISIMLVGSALFAQSSVAHLEKGKNGIMGGLVGDKTIISIYQGEKYDTIAKNGNSNFLENLKKIATKEVCKKKVLRDGINNDGYKIIYIYVSNDYKKSTIFQLDSCK